MHNGQDCVDEGEEDGYRLYVHRFRSHKPEESDREAVTQYPPVRNTKVYHFTSSLHMNAVSRVKK